MNSRRFFLMALAAAFVTLTTVWSVAADKPAEPVEKRIARLIEQLGHTSFAMRQRAQRDLAQIGAEAFDALTIAQDDADVERAMRAGFLMRSIRIAWTSDDDPATVRKYLNGYDTAGEANRIEAVDNLQRVGFGGLPALCRIVRFDKSERVSKYAALKIAALEPKSQAVRATRDKVVQSAIVRSRRPAADWVRMLVDSHTKFDEAIVTWTKLIEAEQQTLIKQPAQSSKQIVAMLLYELIDRLNDRQRWDDVKQLSEQFTKVTDGDWRLLYALAQAEKLQGRDEAAQAAALKTFQLNPKDEMAHWRAGRHLLQQGLTDWSGRELRHVIELGTIYSRAHLSAQYQLAGSLHDQLHDEAAAKVLEDGISELGPLLKDLKARRPVPRGAVRQIDNIVNGMSARMNFYYSEHDRRRGAHDKRVERLRKAVEADPADADVLIALYHLPKADKDLRDKTLKQIAAAAAKFRQIIRQQPDSAFAYNQCAWLLGNTTAETSDEDADEAIRFSQNSLELQPDTGGYLDTLAHCYFTKKDYVSAVKYQKLAIKYDPHSKLIARKLEVFQKALNP